jgi:uncharacterized protein YbjT (DUF2867 family)
MAQICVLGGTGFVGRHLLNRLVERTHKLIVPTRRLAHARDLYLLPTADFIQADIHDDATLATLLRGCHAAVNLVGVLHSRQARSGERYGADFARVHVDLPRRLASACADAGVQHLLHVSALGAAANAPSEYLRSKAAGEEAVSSSRVPSTIFRPSAIFGRHDRFLNLFAELQRLFPIVFLPRPLARFQPVYVEDAAECMARAVLNPQAYGRRYDLCGPKVYTLRELAEYAGRLSGHDRPVLGLSDSMSEAQGAVMELMPMKLMTRDNVRSMKVDSVCDAPLPFGVEATAIEDAAPSWLAGSPRLRIQRWRARASR